VDSERDVELTDLGIIWSGGRERAAAVAWRTCSRGVIGLCGEGEEFGCPVKSGVLNGIILPRRLQRFLEFAEGSAGMLKSEELERTRPASNELRLNAVSCVPEVAWTMPSKPRNRLAVGVWLSLRMIKRRRPGAGWHGAIEGGI
jgi:hypothetical protein